MKNVQVALRVIRHFLMTIGYGPMPFIEQGDSRLMMWGPNEDRIHISTLCCNNKYYIKIEEIGIGSQGQGEGTLIVHTINNIGKILNVSVGLWAHKKDKRIIEWYKKLGYKRRDIFTNEDDIWMELTPKVDREYVVSKIHKGFKLDIFEDQIEIYTLATLGLAKDGNLKLDTLVEESNCLPVVFGIE